MTKKRSLRLRIRNIILANRLVRKLRYLIFQIIIPRITHYFAIFIALCGFIFFFMVFFQPQMMEKLYRKMVPYVWHYLNLDDHKFSTINVDGNRRVSKEEIIAVINETKIETNRNKSTRNEYRPLVQNLIDTMKTKLPWIHKIVITRSIPDILNVSIIEYQPFAIWENENEKYIIDKDGNTVPFEESEEFKNMVILSGNGANTHAKSLFNIFSIDSEFSARIYSATWLGNRRWDIRLDNGLLIKLPESNINRAWQNLIKIYSTPGSTIGLKSIDLRIEDKIYLEYEDLMIKEIKTL